MNGAQAFLILSGNINLQSRKFVVYLLRWQSLSTAYISFPNICGATVDTVFVQSQLYSKWNILKQNYHYENMTMLSIYSDFLIF